MIREIWCRQNRAIKPYIPVVITDKMAAELFDYRAVQTKISLAEYDRWTDLITGSASINLLTDFYRDMLKKYEPNYHHFALLFYLHDLNL